MESAAQLIKNIALWKRLTGTNIKKNAKNVTVYDMKCEEAMDVDGDVFRDVTAKAQRPEGLVRKVSMRFYGKGESSKAWVQCSCEWFKYVCEVALWKENSSDIKYSNGNDPEIKNPREIPIICKHIYATLRAGALDRKPDKSWVKKQLEVQKKEKEEKEKEKKEKAKQREKERQKKLQEKVRKEKQRKEKIEREKKREQQKIKTEKQRQDRLNKFKQDQIRREKDRKIREKERQERKKTQEIQRQRQDQAKKARDRFNKSKK